MTVHDVVIVGAGAAGIAATRALIASNLSVLTLEARDRVGGRAWTVPMRGHMIDLGAHWLHSGQRNPLVALGLERDEPLRLAPRGRHAFANGRPLPARQAIEAGSGWEKVTRALGRAARSGPDRSAAEDLPLLGPYRRRTLAVHGLVCGRPLEEASLKDFVAAQDEDDANWFIAGGYGAYLHRLANNLPIQTGVTVQAIDHGAKTIKLTTSAGEIAARTVLVTMPVMVLQAGGVRFTPELPAATGDALGSFLAGSYEHVVLHWPNAPFHGADRLAGLVGGRYDRFGMMTRIDGSAFHYFELDHPTLNGLRPGSAAQLARDAMKDQFGARSIGDLTVQHVTDWRHDPFSLGSWSVVAAGRYGARQALAEAVDQRLWFAGEATSAKQWGTAGGAWEEGTRAAAEIVAALVK